MRIASLCTGIGMLDHAVVKAFGAEVVWGIDSDPIAARLASHRLGAPVTQGQLDDVDWGELVSNVPDLEGTYRMYDLYCQGLSLAEVAKLEGVTRQTVWTRFTRRKLSMRPRPPAAPFVDYRDRRYSLRDQGYYRATDGDREYLHRQVWMDHNGPIPADHDVHHRDHDKINNDPSNLLCLTKPEHTRLHRGGDAIASFAVDILTAGWP